MTIRPQTALIYVVYHLSQTRASRANSGIQRISKTAQCQSMLFSKNAYIIYF